MFHYVCVVPKCPKCGSYLTGRYLPYTGSDPAKIIKIYLKDGDLVRPTPIMPDNNLFCEACGLEWNADPQWIWVGGSEYRFLKDVKDPSSWEWRFDLPRLSDIEDHEQLRFKDNESVQKIEARDNTTVKDIDPSCGQMVISDKKQGRLFRIIKVILKFLIVDPVIGVIKDAIPSLKKSRSGH